VCHPGEFLRPYYPRYFKGVDDWILHNRFKDLPKPGKIIQKDNILDKGMKKR
jgi:hypothetical protein